MEITKQPTMQIWTDIWHNTDIESFKNIYTDNALIFPPNKEIVQGNQHIFDFMKGGLGKVDVIFEAEELKVSEDLAFEYGIFKDIELSTNKIIGKGKYSITWVLQNTYWKL